MSIRRIIIIFLLAVADRAFGQGQIVFSNLQNTSTNPAATSGGLFWLSTAGTPSLINQDFNAALYGGTDSSNLPLLKMLLLSNGTGIGDNPLPGYFAEPALNSYTIQGALNSAFFRVE